MARSYSATASINGQPHQPESWALQTAESCSLARGFFSWLITKLSNCPLQTIMTMNEWDQTSQHGLLVEFAYLLWMHHCPVHSSAQGWARFKALASTIWNNNQPAAPQLSAKNSQAFLGPSIALYPCPGPPWKVVWWVSYPSVLKQSILSHTYRS